MTLSEAIKTKLLATTALTAICSTRIYANSLPDNSAFPSVVYTLITESHLHTCDGVANLKTALVQIDCMAVGYAVVEAMAAAIVAAFDGFRGAVSTVTIAAALHSNEQDSFESSIPVYRRILEFNVTYS